jgi:hypothetical protein
MVSVLFLRPLMYYYKSSPVNTFDTGWILIVALCNYPDMHKSPDRYSIINLFKKKSGKVREDFKKRAGPELRIPERIRLSS